MVKALLVLMLAAATALEIASIEREILRQGLHRDLKTVVNLKTHSESHCSLVFR